MTWVLYGATGYTGRLMAEEAVRRGMQPVLAGRNTDAISAIAQSLDMEENVFGREHVQEIREAIRGA